MKALHHACIAGYACLSARSDLLDQINVFPVADSDTGANLRISLAPFRSCNGDKNSLIRQVLRAATGNSGNIAASFFSEFLLAENSDSLAGAAAAGRDRAWQAIAEPRQGTMLDVFDSLVGFLARQRVDSHSCAALCQCLQDAVSATTAHLPDLRSAKVVDAGALGMYIFFEGFFCDLTATDTRRASLYTLFQGQLKIAADFAQHLTGSHCVDTLIRPAKDGFDTQRLAALGDSLVVLPDEDRVKIHIHTADPQQLQQALSTFGEILRWSDESLDHVQRPADTAPPAIHLMTDAAGSLSRQMARDHGITLLDSYIVTAAGSCPESLCQPEDIYRQLAAGSKVSTAQGSNFERHQHYRNAVEQYGKSLYLCVGSAFTGNYAAARAWKAGHDPDNLLEILDTGAASGRLAVIALLTSRFARQAETADAVLACARMICDECQEYVFIDTLRYLAAGGRISRAGGFFGDMLRMKPIISPQLEGVRKCGCVHSRHGQLAWACERFAKEADGWNEVLALLQYSDNEAWIAGTVQPALQRILPQAEILRVPLSLTSGVHMGPGSWSLAFGRVS